MDLDNVGNLLKEKYNLLEVYVVFFLVLEYVMIIEYISKYVVEYMEKMVKNGDIVGVSWGMMMYEIVRKIVF